MLEKCNTTDCIFIMHRPKRKSRVGIGSPMNDFFNREKEISPFHFHAESAAIYSDEFTCVVLYKYLAAYFFSAFLAGAAGSSRCAAPMQNKKILRRQLALCTRSPPEASGRFWRRENHVSVSHFRIVCNRCGLMPFPRECLFYTNFLYACWDAFHGYPPSSIYSSPLYI